MSSNDDKNEEQYKAGANVDLHTMKAAEIFKVPPDKVSHDQRRFAKAVNYRFLYGASCTLPRFKRKL